MFEDIKGMLGKLKETQEKLEATKKRLDSILIDQTSADGKLKVTITANRSIKSLVIDDSLLKDKEQLEDYLIITLNRAIEEANRVNDSEIAAVTKEGLPNIPGLDLFK